MKIHLLITTLLILSSCAENEIQYFELNSPEIESFIEKFAQARETDLVLLSITNHQDSTEILLYDLYSTCVLNVGDHYGFLVDLKKWKNVTAPIFKTKVKDIDIYVESGMEKLFKSRKRYAALLEELKGRAGMCVQSYDAVNDEFLLNPPRTSTLMAWKMIINFDGTQMKTMTSTWETFNDLKYEEETVRIDTNYMEKY